MSLMWKGSVLILQLNSICFLNCKSDSYEWEEANIREPTARCLKRNDDNKQDADNTGGERPWH